MSKGKGKIGEVVVERLGLPRGSFAERFTTLESDIPFPCTPRRYDPNVKILPPTCLASSSVFPYVRGREVCVVTVTVDLGGTWLTNKVEQHCKGIARWYLLASVTARGVYSHASMNVLYRKARSITDSLEHLNKHKTCLLSHCCIVSQTDISLMM